MTRAPGERLLLELERLCDVDAAAVHAHNAKPKARSERRTRGCLRSLCDPAITADPHYVVERLSCTPVAELRQGSPLTSVRYEPDSSHGRRLSIPGRYRRFRARDCAADTQAVIPERWDLDRRSIRGHRWPDAPRLAGLQCIAIASALAATAPGPVPMISRHPSWLPQQVRTLKRPTAWRQLCGQL